MERYDEGTVDRFWALVERGEGDDCWNWAGPMRRDGYGIFNLRVRTELAHRLALDLAGVEIPAGHVVLRCCDNRRCCRPDHLMVVTPAERMATRSRLRRVPRPRSGE